jgi:chloramphenicol O-acetyltransferase type A
MRQIDLKTWARREHFEIYRNWAYPHFGMCANVDLTTFRPAIKQHGISFSVAIVYILARVANAIPEFRYRVRPDGAIEHEIVHPSTTIMRDDDLFSFCTFEFTQDFSLFVTSAAERIAYVKEHPTLEDEPGQDDLLFMTSIPWVSFTSFMHPLNLDALDAVPRFAWGKIFEEGESLKMPLSVQGHHAVMDGVHIGRFYNQLQQILHEPRFLLGNE